MAVKCILDDQKANLANAVGIFPVSSGGTSQTTLTSNAVLTGNITDAVKQVSTASGALFAISSSGAASFGTLPVAQGGTELIFAPSVLVNLASTAAASSLQANPQPGVTGTLPLSRGSTG